MKRCTNAMGRMAMKIADAVRAVYAGESVLYPTIAHRVIDRLIYPTPTEPQTTEPLSKREMEVLRLAAKGISNKDIAKELFLTVRTVKAHFTNIFNKMGVGCRTDAITKALREGYISLDDTFGDRE